MTADSVLKILFVCTGNICRSPLAAQLLQAEVTRLHSAVGGESIVHAESRGLQAVAGAPMEGFSARQSEALGGDSSGHIARSVRPADLDAADLIVTMTLEHRADVARMRPTVSKKSVTLLELARLLEHSAPDGAFTDDASPRTPRARLDALLGRRNAVPPPRRQEDLSIPDPFGRSAGTHTRVARQIQAGVVPFAKWIADGAGATPPEPARTPVPERATPAPDRAAPVPEHAAPVPERVTPAPERTAPAPPVPATAAVARASGIERADRAPVPERIAEPVTPPAPPRTPEPVAPASDPPAPKAPPIILSRREARLRGVLEPAPLTRRQAREQGRLDPAPLDELERTTLRGVHAD